MLSSCQNLKPLLKRREVHWLQQSVADVALSDDWLSAAEATQLQKLRFPRRRADWRLGRWAAKCAVAACLKKPFDTRSLRDVEIRTASSGAPEAFIAAQPADLSISLSHRDGLAICAVGPSDMALGCDLEIIEPRCDAFVTDYFTAEEQALIELVPAVDRPQILALLWSAKESTLKALRVGLTLDTRSLTVYLTDYGAAAVADPNVKDWRSLQIRCNTGKVFDGWWQQEGNLIRTLVATAASSRPIQLVTEP